MSQINHPVRNNIRDGPQDNTSWNRALVYCNHGVTIFHENELDRPRRRRKPDETGGTLLGDHMTGNTPNIAFASESADYDTRVYQRAISKRTFSAPRSTHKSRHPRLVLRNTRREVRESAATRVAPVALSASESRCER